MELRQVHYFVAVAEELHFGRAARRLHIGQPAVSQQIRRLERETGLELFDRTTRTVTLTAAGRAFIPHARALLHAERTALKAMARLRGEQEETLRLGTSTGLGTRLDALLSALGDEAPHLLVELVSAPAAARLRRVRDGELDAAFVRGGTEDASEDRALELLPLWQDDLVVALPAGHPLAAHEVVELAALAGMPLRITPRESNPVLFDTVVEACRSAGFTPPLGPAFTTDQDTLAAMATARTGSWTVYYAAQAAVQPASRIAFRRFAAPVPQVWTKLAVRPGSPSPRLAALLAACRTLEETAESAAGRRST